jgi:hypothetical protein
MIFLRISYWLGAVLDGAMIIPMFFPRIGGAIFGIENFRPGNDYRYAMMIGASLMLGWTVLLVWADRKPIERKGIILITAVPVVIGMILAGAFAVSAGLIKAGRMIPTWAIQGVLLFMFLYSYFGTSKEDEKSKC